MRKFVNFIIYAGLSKEDYVIAEDDMHKNNVMMLKMLSSISTAILLLCSVMGFFVPNMYTKIVIYLGGLFFSASILLIALFVKNKKVLRYCMYAFDIVLLGIGLSISLVSAPQQLTVTLIPVSLLIPLFFDTKPFKFLVVVLLADLIYLVVAPFVKPSEILLLDVVDVISFSMSGLLIGTAITKVKIERYVYAHKIQNIAMHDGLTDCYNRTEYNYYIENNMDYLSEDLAVIEIDINDLKSVNDTVGHEAGDEMIVAVSNALKSSFDTYGKCFRTGGDEFVIIADMKETQLKKELEEVIKTLNDHNGKLVSGISVSVGYAYKKECEEKTIRGLIDLADKKMYEDKAKYYSKPTHSRRK